MRRWRKKRKTRQHRTYFALGVDGGFFLQQQVGHFHVAVLGGQMQRREAALRGGRVGRAVFQQHRRHLERNQNRFMAEAENLLSG